MPHNQLINKAREYYDFNWTERYYHNWGHAVAVVNSVQIVDLNPSKELILAAYWHDAVYIPGAGRDANERCSAAALVLSARSDHLYQTAESKDIIEKAMWLIQHTSVEHHLSKEPITGDLATLLDADLSSLAVSYDQFVHNQINIINENGGTYENSKGESATFLNQFLGRREFIYHTSAARLNWEAQARKNIEKYCSI